MANQLALLFALSLYVFGDCLLVAGLRDSPKLTQHNANPCVVYNSTVQEFSADIWLVHDNYSSCTSDTDSGLKVLRIVSSSVNASSDNPVVFVTRMGQKVETWHLPLQPSTFPRSYENFTHTLCSRPSPNNTSLSLSGYDHDSNNVTMYMDVFTSNVTGVEYSFKFQPVENFVLKLGSENKISFQVSPNESHLHYFHFPEGVNAVRVVLSSKNSNNCAIVSVQNASCPVNDKLDNAMSKGMYQTMITSASIVVTDNDKLEHREFFVVIVSASQSVCNRLNELEIINYNDTVQAHDMTLEILELEPASSFVGAVLLPLILFLFIGIATLCVFICPCIHCSFILFKCKDCLKIRFCKQQSERNNYDTLFESNDETDMDESTQINTKTTTYSSIQGQQVTIAGAEGYQTPEASLERTGTFRKMLNESESRVYIDSLTRRGYTDLERSYKVYGWNTITIGIFYALPAFQLVFSQQMILNASGDQDICYYNFKCSHPYLSLSAFNNVWSNIGYLITGLAFLGIVAVRNYRANQERKKNNAQFNNYGVPQFFGVYYAMGFGLVMEAFMSSFYHICPSDNNFQFDTAFMFIIGGLMIVKMLQARHPDIQANAFVAFFCFAIVIFLTFIGIWEWSKPYWQTKFTLFILAMIGIAVFAISYYFFHDWRVGHWIEVHTYKKIYNWFKSWCVVCNSKENVKQLLPKHPYRFVKMTLLVVANLAAGILFVLTGKGIATVVLALFIINFIILLLLYIICKLWYREPITLMPVVFLILLGVFWLAAFYFYFTNVSQWEGSPAESREYNRNCLVMKFYDNHDIWHFLSAGAMFFSFLFLLTLDDGTQALEREKIHVF